MNSSLLTNVLSVSRNILVSLWLKLSKVLAIIACIGVHFPVVELDYPDWFSIVAGPFRCQISCGISTVTVKPVQSIILTSST